ncbi:UAA transporter family-domain-containing protein [Papiliotrema laurentii]|uniref:UAA transporter family-domain-containing protein n=1 Tax=Papiliotrema laurentii TaxID=5418 RepID=A0AAD9CWX6_PAPLA|nr:UAA transporter family-domain-containing protein [Papiliotrema laurentii]
MPGGFDRVDLDNLFTMHWPTIYQCSHSLSGLLRSNRNGHTPIVRTAKRQIRIPTFSLWMDSDLLKGLAQSATVDWLFILSLVFGGCCSNVWALEAVLHRLPASGTFLTFAQFAFVAVQNLSSQITLHWNGPVPWPRLRKRTVPLQRWMVQVVLFLGVSLINNYVFALKIPLTLHIIFRSGGSWLLGFWADRLGLCVSMLVGYLAGKRKFTVGQLAGIMITIGITVATITTPKPKATAHASERSTKLEFASGISLLTFALFLSAWLGLYQEETYRRHGKQWREGIFYTHFLSLPFFFPLYPTIRSTFASFLRSPTVSLAVLPYVGMPSAILALLVNVSTQALCIRGVNRLTARVNSTTVNLVLTVRKAVSLALSAWYYGHGMSHGLLLGGAMVLVGTVIYSTTGERQRAKASQLDGVSSARSSAIGQPQELRRRKL